MSDTRVEWEFDEQRRRAHVGCGGTVALHDGRPRCSRCGALDGNAGWLKRVLMWNWHWIALDGYPEWDLVESANGRHPPFVELLVVKGRDRPASEIEIEWDDHATGLFYHRDWTADGIPFVRDGDAYRAGFWFQKAPDAEAFTARYSAGHSATATSDSAPPSPSRLPKSDLRRGTTDVASVEHVVKL